MTDDNRPAWFAAKRYGLGAALPIAWQGWGLLIGYVAIVVGAGLLFEHQPAVSFAIIVPVTIVLIIVAARTTRGGWRWRWGGDK